MSLHDELVGEVLAELDGKFSKPFGLELVLEHRTRTNANAVRYGMASKRGVDKYRMTLYVGNMNELSNAAMRDVIRHEFAHIEHSLQGYFMSHSHLWQIIARQFGARPFRSSYNDEREEWAATYEKRRA